MLSRRSLANIGLLAVAAILLLVTKRWESVLTVVLPALVINWIVSREDHLQRGGGTRSEIRWQTAFLNFAVPLGLCLCVILFWFPRHLGNFPVWGAYLIGSFSMALLLVKPYERF